MNTTKDDYPTLPADYMIPQDTIATSHRKGHVTLRGICTAEEIEPYRVLMTEEIERSKSTELGGIYTKELKDRGTRHNAFMQFMNMWTRDKRLARFILAERFGHIAAQLLGVDAVRIYHDQALFKEPGAGYTPWHQDQFYWPLETGKTVTMWMPLTPMGAEMGTLIFADGTHQNGPLGELEISDHSEAYYQQMIQEQNRTLAISELHAGDATWHYGWTLHKAPGNTTNRMRQVIAIIFCAADTRITNPKNEKQWDDLATWMPGQNPGETIGSRLNPLVWEHTLAHLDTGVR